MLTINNIELDLPQDKNEELNELEKLAGIKRQD